LANELSTRCSCRSPAGSWPKAVKSATPSCFARRDTRRNSYTANKAGPGHRIISLPPISTLPPYAQREGTLGLEAALRWGNTSPIAATKGHGMEVAVRDQKDRLSELLRKAEAGDKIVVIPHGRPIARMLSVEQARAHRRVGGAGAPAGPPQAAFRIQPADQQGWPTRCPPRLTASRSWAT